MLETLAKFLLCTTTNEDWHDEYVQPESSLKHLDLGEPYADIHPVPIMEKYSCSWHM